MKKFKLLENKPIASVEQDILNSWGSVNTILNETIKNRKNAPYWVFYDGPATANGHPGLHHMLAKFLKDTFCKYKTMQGYQVIRKIGWDTHGLPVELQVEKKLGFNSKNDIEKYGIEAFNQKCRESVFENEKTFTDLTSKMGQFIDLEDPYITYDNNYIETEWWILKKFYEEGYFYSGSKILPYCPRCGTGLASHEVAQGYKEVGVDTVIVPMKKKDSDTYFLVWTTTPWTLISNVALCVNPNETYIEVEKQGLQFILAEKLAHSILGEEDYLIKNKFQGKELEFQEYEQLIPSLSVDRKAFYITCDDYVTMDAGTGIVHIAPAFGEDDAKVGKKYNLPYLNPVGEDGKYQEGPWKGQLVFDADLEIIKYLKANDKLFKKQKITHNYPHCWRCNTPLIYYSKPSYYLEITKLKDQIIAANQSVHWYPSYVGEKRFGNWLEDLKDWAISRNRYWGTPLPLWICSCHHEEMIGSRKELIEKSITPIDEKTIELHRPYVDDIKLKCPKCGKEMTRVKDVIDCWFDSGSMPFAQYHYPFEHQDLFETQFPADFICEGIDQTRGWFYTLLVISTFLKGCAPYKNVLVNELVQDAEGKKMSKSKGNIVEPFSTMAEFGADVTRFYLPYVSPVWTPLRFDLKGLKEVYSKFMNPLKNTYNFFAMYANTDEIEIESCQIPYQEREEIDRWLLSKYNHLVSEVTIHFEEFDLNKVVRAIANFVSEDLSNWYIRRNRKRFWESKLTNSKKSVYKTTYEVLVGLSKLIAPITPFVSEEIYRNLTHEKSVHLSDYPTIQTEHLDESLEERMDLVRNLISIGRNIREEVKIKVREPLSECLLDQKLESSLKELIPLIEEELNVKKVSFIQDLSPYMNFFIKPNFKEAGKIMGSKMKEFQTALENLTDQEKTAFQKGKNIIMNLQSEEYEITPNLVDIRITAKDGFDVAMENNLFVILNTEQTEELILEGLAREFVSKVQNIRKNNNLEVTDRIQINYYGTEKIKKAVTTFLDYIKEETLAEKIIEEKGKESYELNGEMTELDIIKITEKER
ncbi:MAG: isoleucine--tRNA ligase [Bacilli bacterium]|jgi:isoleucyl-tRNA synthetase|nr:isoleucine--tRNA ligase [Bacilli bacterium]